MVEYKPLPESALDDYRAALSYAFNPTSERYDPEEAEELGPPAKVGDRRGLFDGDELVSVCSNIYFQTRVREEWHPMAGLSAVATPPEFRRKGHVETMLAEALEEYREEGAYISSLWAFSHPFYGKYGWALSNQYAIQEGSPGAFSFTRELTGGSFYEVEPEEWDSLNDVLLANSEEYELTVDRTEEWWRNRVFHGWQTDPYVYVWEEGGSIEAYVVYDIHDTESGNSQIQVWEIAWRTREAKLHLLRFIANHEDHVDSIQIKTPVDELFLDELTDPSELTYTIRPGPMVRIVDVKAALEALEYDGTRQVSLTLDVEDPLAPWNDSSVSLHIEDDQATVEETDTSPDISISIGALSQLYVGYRSAADLRRNGDLEANDPGVVSDLSAMFPERSVYLREKF